MGSEWEECRLEEITKLIIDCPHFTPKWKDEGIIVLRSQYVKKGRLNLSSPSFTDEEGYQSRIKRAVPTAEDLVFTREAPMGEVCQIPENLKCCLGQRMVLIRANQELVDSKYLLYVIQSPYLQHQISWNEGTGTTVSNIRMGNIYDFKIPLPALPEQKAIAHILGALDDKIELNRQMNETLEAMAQALFKSWFVDFDPVIDNALAAGNPIPDVFSERAKQHQILQNAPDKTHRAQFPNAFEYTEEMGWIPEGWGVAELSDIAEHIKNNVKAEDIASDEMYVGLEHIGKKQIFLSDFDSGDKVTSNKSRFEKTNILFGKLRPYFHKVCIAPADGICSTDILIFKPKKEKFHSFLSMVLFSDKLVEYANLRSTGTRMPRANVKDMLAYNVLNIPCKITDSFELLLAPIWVKGISATEENKTLTQLRDTLLLKLLSGELRIPDAEKLIEDY